MVAGGERPHRDAFWRGHRGRTPIGATQIAGRKAVVEVAAARVLMTISAAVITPRDETDDGPPIKHNGVGLGIELVAAAPSAVARGEIDEGGGRRVVVKVERHSEGVCAQEVGIGLPGLLKIVDRVEERKGEALRRRTAGIVFECEGEFVPILIPVAHVSSDPHFALERGSDVGDFGFVEHGVGPRLSRHFYAVAAAHTEARDEAHQFEWCIVSRCGDERVKVFAIQSAARHTLQVVDGIKKTLRLAGGHDKDGAGAVVGIAIAILREFDKHLSVNGRFGQAHFLQNDAAASATIDPLGHQAVGARQPAAVEAHPLLIEHAHRLHPALSKDVVEHRFAQAAPHTKRLPIQRTDDRDKDGGAHLAVAVAHDFEHQAIGHTSLILRCATKGKTPRHPHLISVGIEHHAINTTRQSQ